MVKKIFFTLCLILVLTGTAWTEDNPGGVKVVAEGYSYLGDDSSIKEARTKAMAEAEQAALEQGVPIYLESYTKAKNYQVDTDEIKSRLKGYIKNKKVIIDELDKDNLKYKIRIEAVISYAEEKEVPQPTEKEVPYVPVTDQSKCDFSEDDMWDIKQRLTALHKGHPKKYIHLMELLYPNVNPKRIYDHLKTIQRYNRLKFDQIMTLITGIPFRRKIHLEYPAVRRKIMNQLRNLFKKHPQKYIEFLRLALPHLNDKEIGARLKRVCENHPRVMQKIEDILASC